MINWIKEKVINLLVGNYLGSFVRTGIAFLAGWLASSGIATTEQAASLAALLLALWKPFMLWLVAQASSLINKLPNKTNEAPNVVSAVRQ